MAKSGRMEMYFILEEVMYRSGVWRIEVLKGLSPATVEVQ